MLDDDPLAKWRRPGFEPGNTAAGENAALTLRMYEAYTAETTGQRFLLLKRGLIKSKPASHRALPYGYLFDMESDGYGFFFNLSYSLPHIGFVSVSFHGEGMTPLLEAILRGAVSSVQIFDPDRFIAPAAGTFDIEADEWRGPTVVKEITFNEVIPSKDQRH